jgi:hypothetical protein
VTTALDWPSFIGLCGTACIFGAYAYVTLARAANPFVLHGTNLLGAMLLILLILSLIFHTNRASLVREFFWALIAILGLARAWRAHKQEMA